MSRGGRDGVPVEYVRNLALSLVQSGPPQERLLTSIYRDSLTQPLSEGLEDLLLRMEAWGEEPGRVRNQGN
jgi:hypothetical protein